MNKSWFLQLKICKLAAVATVNDDLVQALKAETFIGFYCFLYKPQAIEDFFNASLLQLQALKLTLITKKKLNMYIPLCTEPQI